MKRQIILAFGLASVLLGLGAWAKPLVVATHAVLAELARATGGNEVEVVSLIPAGFCPAHFDLAPSDLAAVREATVILYSGFEPWIEKLQEVAGHGAIIPVPGVWDVPSGASAELDLVQDALSQALPDLAAVFATNADAYRARLAEIQARLEAQALEEGVLGIPVLSIAWQASFVSWLGFSIVRTYAQPDALSLRDLANLVEIGKQRGVRLVIDNLQSGVGFGAKLAQTLGAVHVVLSTFPGALPGTPTLLDLYEANAEALFSALVPLQ